MTQGADWLSGHHLWFPYARMKSAAPLGVTRTEGSRITLADGRVLIDGIASWWTACHGYNHPHIRDAVARQLEVMPHVMFGGLAHEPAARLAQRLTDLLPGDLAHVFFSDSGSVAVEVALKMATQCWINRGVAGRTRFLAFWGAYHGDTSGAMAVSDPEDMHKQFSGMLPQHDFLALPRDEESVRALEDHLARYAKSIAAIVVEPLVQGAGGMLFHPPEVLRALRQAADRHNVLLIFDEIFTGFGRTGSMFACKETVPDIITLSKALTGGTLPLAATVANEKVFAAFRSDDPNHMLMHGPTFMANALACAAANASLDLFEREPRIEQVAAIEAQLREELAPCHAFAGVADVRVKGAIGVVELEKPPDVEALRRKFVSVGVWIRPFGRTVYLTPAFTIASADLSALTGAIRSVLRDWR